MNFPGIYTGGSTSFTKWDQTTADPIADIERWFEEMSNTTGEQPGVLIAGRKVFRLLAGATKFQSLAALFRGGTTDTTVTSNIVKGLFSQFLGLEIIPYDALLTTRSYSAAGVPSVVRSRILDEKHIILAPSSALGVMATSPNPIDFATTGLYSWTKQESDPWVVENGVGINAFPDFKWPERCGYIQVLT